MTVLDFDSEGFQCLERREHLDMDMDIDRYRYMSALYRV